MKKISSIAFVVNPNKDGACSLAEELREITKPLHIKSTVITDYPLKKHQLDNTDLCCVIGGDGTILGVVNEAVRTNTPILGINLGKLGFLATYTPEEIKSRISSIISGEYCTDARSLIECGNNSEEPLIALNDIAIKSTTINLIQLQVYQDKERVAEYRCDGLIFASPTGSTAYNLSAGGPIIHPQNNSIAMTPICPHTLSSRSFIFSDTVNLSVECDCNQQKPSISIDGRHYNHPESLFPFHIKMSSKKLFLIHEPNYSHYRMLRKKLNWV